VLSLVKREGGRRTEGDASLEDGGSTSTVRNPLGLPIGGLTISQTEGAGPSQKQKKAAKSSAAKAAKRPVVSSPDWSDDEGEPPCDYEQGSD
jgi:hypothetical protein